MTKPVLVVLIVLGTLVVIAALARGIAGDSVANAIRSGIADENSGVINASWNFFGIG